MVSRKLVSIRSGDGARDHIGDDPRDLISPNTVQIVAGEQQVFEPFALVGRTAFLPVGVVVIPVMCWFNGNWNFDCRMLANW